MSICYFRKEHKRKLFFPIWFTTWNVEQNSTEYISLYNIFCKYHFIFTKSQPSFQAIQKLLPPPNLITYWILKSNSFIQSVREWIFKEKFSLLRIKGIGQNLITDAQFYLKKRHRNHNKNNYDFLKVLNCVVQRATRYLIMHIDL